MALGTFKKSERLHKKKLIQELFSKGSYFYLSPFKVLYLRQEGLETCQLLISVPKKYIKKAVDRNKIKRRIREAYRTSEGKPNAPQLIAFIYNDKALKPFKEIKLLVERAVQKLNQN